MYGRCPLFKKKVSLSLSLLKKEEILGNLVASQTARHFLLRVVSVF